MDILTQIWIAIDVAVCIATFVSYGLRNNAPIPDFLKDIVTWGKTRDDADDKKRSLPWFQNVLLVPKRWFIHFYACGLIWNVYLLTMFVQTCFQESPSLHGVLKLVPILNENSHTSKQDCFTVFLTLTLITFQLTRRLYESLFVSSYSGKMHVVHYMIGMVFYGMVNLTIIAEIPTPLNQGWCNSCLKPSFKTPCLYHLLAISMFAWASYHQYNCHIILGKLTAWSPSGTKMYKIPHGDWFAYVSSPHYLAEIIIYISLFLIMQGLTQKLLFLVLFVILNLGLAASITHEWYQKKFESYPKCRTRIIPYIY